MFWLLTVKDPFVVNKLALGKADEVLRNLLLLFVLSLGVGIVSPLEATDPMDCGSPSSDKWTDNSILL
jgi:hypothetical protein